MRTLSYSHWYRLTGYGTSGFESISNGIHEGGKAFAEQLFGIPIMIGGS